MWDCLMLSCRWIGQLYTITCLFSDILGVTTSFWFALFHFYAFCSPTQSRTFRPRRASQIRTAIKDRKLRLTGHSGKCLHQYMKSQDTVVSVVHQYMKSQDTVVSVYINIWNHRTQWSVYTSIYEITGHSGKCLHQYMKSQDTVVSVYIIIWNHRTQW